MGYLIERYWIEIWWLFGDFNIAVVLGAWWYIMPDFIRDYRENRRCENMNYNKTMLNFIKNNYFEEFEALRHLIRKKTKDNRVVLDLQEIKEATEWMTVKNRIHYIKSLLLEKE